MGWLLEHCPHTTHGAHLNISSLMRRADLRGRLNNTPPQTCRYPCPNCWKLWKCDYVTPPGRKGITDVIKLKTVIEIILCYPGNTGSAPGSYKWTFSACGRGGKCDLGKKAQRDAIVLPLKLEEGDMSPKIKVNTRDRKGRGDRPPRASEGDTALPMPWFSPERLASHPQSCETGNLWCLNPLHLW